jgi:anti-anti-sigma factor
LSARRAAGALRAAVRGVAELLLERPGPYARAFEQLILALIVLSVVSVGVEALPGLPPWITRPLRVGEILVVAVFSFEYLLRLIAAREKLKFVLSFAGVIDLLSIAPFYLGGIDARWLRTLRLLRLLRVLKLRTHILESSVAERTRELAEKNALLEQAQAQINAELDVARALQVAILPATFPARPGCDSAARMIPATTMGGDFYDFIELPGGQIGLVMADVSGKGVPAAFFMAVARTNLRGVAPDYADPGACLARTNTVLCTQNPLDLFVTVFYCMLDPATGALRYANGGHNPPYLRRADGSVEALSGAGGLVLGAMPGVEFPEHQIQLRAGDLLVLYTDGVTEAFNPADEAYGTERLIEEIRAHGAGPAAASSTDLPQRHGLCRRRAPVRRHHADRAQLESHGSRGAAVNIELETLGQTTLVMPQGRLDFGSAPSLQQRLEQLLAGGEGAPAALIIDCAALDYVSSAGLRVFLLAARASQRAGIAFAVCSLKPPVREVFDLSGFCRRISVHADRASAFAQLQPGRA